MVFVTSWYPTEPWAELYREVPSAQAAGPGWDVASQREHGGFACSRTLLWGPQRGLMKGPLARHSIALPSVLTEPHGGAVCAAAPPPRALPQPCRDRKSVV